MLINNKQTEQVAQEINGLKEEVRKSVEISSQSLDKIKNLPLPITISSYIHSFVVKLVNVWRYSVNYWLLYTLVCLLLFNCACVYSFYMALSVIN